MTRLLHPVAARFLDDLMLGFTSSEPTPCRWLASYQDLSEASPDQTSVTEDLAQRVRGQCEFSRKLRALIFPTFFRLAYSPELRVPFYSVDVMFGDEYLWQTFGVFTDKGSCNDLRRVAIQLGYRVRACRREA